MTLEDKELTEHAALAAGILVEWQEAHQCFWISAGQGILNHRAWAPLDNDGQALRLANRLRISLTMYNEGVTTRHFSRFTRTLGSEIGCEDVATRRAIVTAAASMWLDHVDEMDKGEIAPAAIAGGGWSALKMVATKGDGRLADVPREE
ncbi:hypothetical protein PQR39_26165 [Paraburkholderia sediminicola]|uniref:hypothetical protein n=1 Tax=Paraburkholderia sediminicola TaxID=458836 RepID=UPI0038B90CF2